MKTKWLRGIIITSILLCVVLAAGAIAYVFVIDPGKPRMYAPTIESDLLREQAERLSFSPSADGEYQIDRNGFQAIAVLYTEQVPPQERQDRIEAARLYAGLGSLSVSFDEADIDIIAAAGYMPLLNTLGYGWYTTHTGNLYARRYGDDAAQGLPNYRNNFLFFIWVNDRSYCFDLYCSTASAEIALTETVAYYNELCA